MGRWATMTEEQRAGARRRNLEYYYRSHGKQLARSKAYRAKDPVKKAAAVTKCRDRNREIIRLAKDKPCVDCGNQYHQAAMDFDHVRGTKIKAITKMLDAPIDRLLAELAKCDIRCAVCHRTRHALEKGG